MRERKRECTTEKKEKMRMNEMISEKREVRDKAM